MDNDKIKEALEVFKSSKNKDDLKNKVKELGQENMNSDEMEKIMTLVDRFKGEYKDKSEEELFDEIEKVKETVDMNSVKKTVAKNKKAIKQLYTMMDDTQKKRFEKNIKYVEGINKQINKGWKFPSFIYLW